MQLFTDWNNRKKTPNYFLGESPIYRKKDFRKRYGMKKLVMKNPTASHEVLRWIGNCGPSVRLYRPGGPGLPINKRMAALVLLLVICVFQVADDDFGLDEKIGMVLQMLSSPWVKGIACIALIVECIGLITAGRQEPGMFRSHAGPLKVYPLDRRHHPLYGGGHHHQQVHFR
jgi:hypothetical protein